ncbi:MAG TPA: hypothetical protein PK609_01425 [Candidatus Paceibacterota bacterium]|nr:hypothetical protein [Candidatus Paceibacterota bacterium]
MKAIKVSVIVQASHEESVRKALAEAGAGKLGNYTKCQFVTKGEAQFEPEAGSDPAVGEKFELDKVPAVQIQTWCAEDQVEEVVRQVRAAHPNEEPGIELMPFELR